MSVTNCSEMINLAHGNRYAVAQLNTNGGNYDLSRAILEAAESVRSPIILGVYEKNAQYAGMKYIAQSLRQLAEEFAPSVPVAIHLDHGSGFTVCDLAIRAGFTSVMFDGSALPIADNIDASSAICDAAHNVGVTCEAEVGTLLTGESDPDNPNLVQVEDVVSLTDAVPVDMLAVAIGNSHGFYKGPPELNMTRLREAADATDVPLVLHGTTGLLPEQIKMCISMGMAKVNLGTILRTDYLQYYRRAIEDIDHQGHPWRVSKSVMESLRDDCIRFLQLVGSAGKAEG